MLIRFVFSATMSFCYHISNLNGDVYIVQGKLDENMLRRMFFFFLLNFSSAHSFPSRYFLLSFFFFHCIALRLFSLAGDFLSLFRNAIIKWVSPWFFFFLFFSLAFGLIFLFGYAWCCFHVTKPQRHTAVIHNFFLLLLLLFRRWFIFHHFFTVPFAFVYASMSSCTVYERIWAISVHAILRETL